MKNVGTIVVLACVLLLFATVIAKAIVEVPLIEVDGSYYRCRKYKLPVDGEPLLLCDCMFFGDIQIDSPKSVVITGGSKCCQ